MAIAIQHRKHMIAPRISAVARDNLKAACLEFAMSLNEIVDRAFSKPDKLAALIIDTITDPAYDTELPKGGNPDYIAVKAAREAGKRLSPRQRKAYKKMQDNLRRARAAQRKNRRRKPSTRAPKARTERKAVRHGA